MRALRSVMLSFGVVLAGATIALAQQAPAGSAPAAPAQAPAAAAGPGQTQTQTQTQTQSQSQSQSQSQAPPQGQAQGQAPPSGYQTTVVVTASRTEEDLINAPATMTVIGEKALAVAPSTSYADLLRSVPGINVTQLSARDINITSRAATSSLATSQLALVDGRSIYQDFFGFVMWDFLPVSVDAIKRIEVIRGPASAVWGANAVDGVVNVITKTPREMLGTTVTLGAGGFSRAVNGNGASPGSLFYLDGTYAQALNDRWAYKLSLGAFTQDALPRPTGLIPNGTGTPYPPFTNSGTTQPKLDARVDYDFPDKTRSLSFSGGSSGTSGIMHSGIGPFDIQNGATLSYAKASYAKSALTIQAFTNILNGNATNLLTVGTNGQPIAFAFKAETLDGEISNATAVGTRQVLTYGGNLRYNHFNLTLAPGQTQRTEGGAYLQDEVFVTDRTRLVAGARVDKFSSISGAVVSPRVALVFKPRPNHAVRLSYNRAFRAPSMINNNLDVTIATPFPLALLSPAFGSAQVLVPTTAVGNADLKAERLDAFELGYTGLLARATTLSAAVYYNRLSNEILFTETGEYALTTPPNGWPASLAPYWPLVQSSAHFPSSYSYLNLGREVDKGLELGANSQVMPRVNAFANYSFQATPVPSFPSYSPTAALAEINIPARHRVNVGASYSDDRYVASLTVNHTSSAFWQDVLDARYHGSTNPYTMVNVSAGVKWSGGKYKATLKVVNLANQAILQHIFGDVLKRQIVGELTVRLPK